MHPKRMQNPNAKRPAPFPRGPSCNTLQEPADFPARYQTNAARALPFEPTVTVLVFSTPLWLACTV
jgi:hypothetical protein